MQVRTVRRSLRRGAVLLMAFWCLMALSFTVYGAHEACVLNYRVFANLVENEQCFWAAVGAVQKTAAWLVTQDPPDSCIKTGQTPEWFRGETLGGARFEISQRPYEPTDSIRYNVEDEAARINLNRCPSNVAPGPSYLGPTPSVVLETLVAGVKGWESRAGEVQNAVEEAKSTIREKRGSGAGEAVENLDAFRHPYELFELAPAVDPSLWFGEDYNENYILDPNECDGDATPPADNGDSILDPGLRDEVTTFSDGKFNPLTAPRERLDVMLADFPAELRDQIYAGRQEVSDPAAFESWFPEGDRQRTAYRAFAREYLTGETSTFRVTAQVYQHDGTWRGCIEELLRLERDPSDQNRRFFTSVHRYYR